MTYKWTLLFYLVYLTKPVLLLDLDNAFSQGIFREISFDYEVSTHTLDPDKIPAINLYFDRSRGTHNVHPLPHRNKNIEFVVQNIGHNYDFKVGISVLILAFDPNDVSKIKISGTMDSPMNRKLLGTFKDPIPLPTTNISSEHIFKSWEIWTDDKFPMASMSISLENWTSDSKVYLVTTAYRVQREHSKAKQCDSWGRNTWWNCIQESDQFRTRDEIAETSSPGLVCISYGLTCDGLPHCAETSVPNPDEDCHFEVGISEAVELMVYAVLTLFLILLLAGGAKCLLRRSCIGERGLFRGERRESDMSDILPAEPQETVRPENAPPTYEDAMKFVNEAFALTDTEEDDDRDGQGRPPTYSPQPREGEEIVREGASRQAANCECSATNTSHDVVFAAIPAIHLLGREEEEVGDNDRASRHVDLRQTDLLGDSLTNVLCDRQTDTMRDRHTDVTRDRQSDRHTYLPRDPPGYQE